MARTKKHKAPPANLTADVPLWVPETIGFWGENGAWQNWTTQRNWLLSQTADVRLHRLFAVACAYRTLRLYEAKYQNDMRLRQAIETAELFADGKISKAKLLKARQSAAAAAYAAAAADAYAAYAAAAATADYAVAYAAADAAAAAAACAATATYAADYAAACAAAAAADAVARLNHSRILTLILPRNEWSADWTTSTARGLAEGIYWDRAWDRLPILADALEEAGCDNLFALKVCRELPAECCFRGLWVVDMALNLRGV